MFLCVLYLYSWWDQIWNHLQKKQKERKKESTLTHSLNISFLFVFCYSLWLPARLSWSNLLYIKHCLYLTLFCPRGALLINSTGFSEPWQFLFDLLCCFPTCSGVFKPSQSILKWRATLLITLSLLLRLLNFPYTTTTGKTRALHSQN